MKPILRFEGVTLRRGGQLLLEGLDLEVRPGEAVQVTGPNGSGKTSLLRLAAGLLRPERGTIERESLALSDENIALDRELSLAKALGFWGGAVEDAMEVLGLSELADVSVQLLSSGQAKRASLARVAASGAPLWLLDEPANGLDLASSGKLAALIERHRHGGGAVLAASHSPLAGEWKRLELG